MGKAQIIVLTIAASNNILTGWAQAIKVHLYGKRENKADL